MGRRKVWNAGTELRYEAKAYGTWAGRNLPPELLNAVVRAQSRQWGAGAWRYKDVRDRVRLTVFNNPATMVSPIDRAAYYAFAQRLFKLCVVTGEADPEDVIREFTAKSDRWNMAVLDAIVEVITPRQREIVTPATPA